MSVRIRLQRQGKKKKAFYHIVVADQRSPRDGRNIERLGSYDPNTNPATINIDNEKAVEWLLKGAQPSDTARAILNYKGVMLQKHLEVGVRKGAITKEEADKRFTDWLKQKQEKIDAKVKKLADAAEADAKQRLEAEQKVNQERAERIAKKRSELSAELEASAKEAATEANEAVAEAETSKVAAAENTTEATAEQSTEAAKPQVAEESATAEEPAKEEPTKKDGEEEAPKA